MFIAFTLEAVGILGARAYGHDPLLFVLLGGMVFFAWGEIASLFPATCADCSATKYATTNAGLLYTPRARPRCRCRSPACWSRRLDSWHDRLPGRGRR